MIQLIMRGESRSRSRSPTGSNDYKGDRGATNDTPPCNKVYVAFLPEDIQENQLKDLFEECGSIVKLFLKKKQDGFTFAHIQYQSVEEAKNAIDSLNKRKVGGKNIRVQFSRQFNRNEGKERGDSRDRNDRNGDRNGGGDRGGRGGDNRRESDTRRRFQNDGSGFEGRGRGGRGRGGGFRDGGERNYGNGRNQSGGGRGGGDRGPMKCYKCQGQGHISKNCTNGDGGDQRKGDYKNTRPPKVDKMSEDEDY